MPENQESARDDDGFRNRGAEVTRIEAFYDAAFAFAITLMVISIDEIPNSAESLIDALKSVPAFAASFLMIVLFWSAHSTWSRRYGINDRPSQRLSLLTVFLVLVFIYPMRMVFAGFFFWISDGWLPAHIDTSDGPGDMRLIIVAFAVAFGTMGAATWALYRHAWNLRDKLGLDARETIVTRYSVLRWVAVPIVSSLSLILSIVLSMFPANAWLVATPALLFFLLLLNRRWLHWRMQADLRDLEASH
ncbi:TMEM175 family protein [Dokdonella sp.]|uniref:TMEM175 family protein n=1 Tax=Dokdonella sp. TaxID=2291710 RepID=UPI0035276263